MVGAEALFRSDSAAAVVAAGVRAEACSTGLAIAIAASAVAVFAGALLGRNACRVGVFLQRAKLVSVLSGEISSLHCVTAIRKSLAGELMAVSAVILDSEVVDGTHFILRRVERLMLCVVGASSYSISGVSHS